MKLVTNNNQIIVILVIANCKFVLHVPLKISGKEQRGVKIMSKWTETRDSMVEELRKAAMSEEAKQRVTAAVISEGLPIMETAVEGYASKLEEEAKRDERAWVRWGEGIVLPGLLRVAMWLIKLTLKKSMEAQGKGTAEPAGEPGNAAV